MKQFSSPTQKTGLIGESIAEKYLVDKGFLIIERNYTKQTGEIDIVATRPGSPYLHFIEVKTMIRYSETYHPFENLTRSKILKIARTIQWYLIERKVSRETPWVIDAIAVSIHRETKTAKIDVMWNVIL